MVLTVSALLALSSLPVPSLVAREALGQNKVEIIRPAPKKAASKTLAPPSVEQAVVLDKSRSAAPATGAECAPEKAENAELKKALEEKDAKDRAEAEKKQAEEKSRAAQIKKIEKLGQHVRDGFDSLNESLSTGE
jgi:hypothetical protein